MKIVWTLDMSMASLYIGYLGSIALGRDLIGGCQLATIVRNK